MKPWEKYKTEEVTAAPWEKYKAQQEDVSAKEDAAKRAAAEAQIAEGREEYKDATGPHPSILGDRSVRDYILPAGLTKYEEKPGERTLLGDIFERPGAAHRSAIRGDGYKKGASLPEDVQLFQDQILDKYYDGRDPSRLTTQIGGVGASAAGYAADFLTNPAEMALALSSGLKGVRTSTVKSLDKIEDTSKALSKSVVRGTKRTFPANAARKIKLAESVRNEIRITQAEAIKSADNLIPGIVDKVDDILDPKNQVIFSKKLTGEPRLRAALEKGIKTTDKKTIDVAVRYAKAASNFRKIEGKIQAGNILSNLSTKFGDAELSKAANGLLGKSLQKEISSYRRNVKSYKMLGEVAKWSSILGVGGGIAKRVIGTLSGGLLD